MSESNLKIKMNPCGVCAKSVNKNSKGVDCDGCEVWYHRKCGEISEDTYKEIYERSQTSTPMEWKCKKCVQNGNKLVKHDGEYAELLFKIANDMSELIKTNQLQFDSIKIQQLETNLKLDGIREELGMKIERQVAKELKPITETISKLKYENELLHNKMLRNDIIFDNVADFVDEAEAKKFVVSVANFLKVKISFDDISICRYITNTKLLVTIINLTKRDKLMRRYNDLPNKSLHFSDVGLEEEEEKNNTRIFINDNVTTLQIKLKRMARILKKEEYIKYYKFRSCRLVLDMKDDSVETIYDDDELRTMFPNIDFDRKMNRNNNMNMQIHGKSRRGSGRRGNTKVKGRSNNIKESQSNYISSDGQVIGNTTQFPPAYRNNNVDGTSINNDRENE